MRNKFNILLVFFFVAALGTAGLRLYLKTNDDSTNISNEEPAAYAASIDSALSREPQLFDRLSLQEFEPAELQLEAAQIFDLKYHYPIWGINTEHRWPLASLTKLMTAVVALEHLPANQVIVIDETALAAPGTAGNFAVGEEFTVNDLVRAMMAVSSNDAAVALTETMPAGEFVRLMNEKAAELGMQNTYFADGSGLSFLNQSTPADLVRLVKYIYYHQPNILTVSRLQKVDIIEKRSGNRRILWNINRFAGRPDFLGGKTGFTDEAQGNLISLFSIDGRPVLFIVFGALGPDNRFAETEKLLNFIYDSRRDY